MTQTRVFPASRFIRDLIVANCSRQLIRKGYGDLAGIAIMFRCALGRI